MKIVSNRFAILCAAFALASILDFSAQAQITVDGVREADYGSPIAVQSITSSWGAGNTLASFSAKQDGSKLYVFVAGRANGNSLYLFIDSKTGGANKLVSGLVSGGGEEWRIHNLSVNGSSTTDGMTFEAGFTADYAINIQSAGWSALFPLDPVSPKPRSYIGNIINDAPGISGGPLTKGKQSTDVDVVSVATHANGWEFEFNITNLGVGNGEAETVKFMAFIVSDGVNSSPNQVLGSLPDSTALGGWGIIQTTNFETISGIQAITVSVNNADADSDGIPNSTDTDDDNDGLTDTEENALGTNPLLADTDGDGRNDKSEVDAGTNPLKKNYNSMLIAGNFLNPTWSGDATSENTMSLVSGEQFQWQLNRRFTTVRTIQYKFLGGSWAQNWGASATPGTASFDSGNISSQITATGIYTFAFNNDTLAYSFTRATKPGTYAAWATTMGATGAASDDDDSDGLSNQDEYANDSDPLSNDTDGDGLTDNYEVIGFNDFSIVTSPITPDTDQDGLRDAWELQFGLNPADNGTMVNYVNNTGLAVVSNPNGANADPDADGLTNFQEQAAGTNPLAAGTGFASTLSKITVPGSFNGFDAVGNAANTMQLVGNFSWKLLVYFATAPTGNSEYKFAAGGWSTNWGPSATPGVAELSTFSNIQASSVLTAAGYYVFNFNDNTLGYSLAPLATADADTDGLPDEWEAFYGGYLNPKLTNLNPATAYIVGSSTTAAQAYAAGSNPVADMVGPVITLNGNALVGVALNASYTDAGATATDNVDPSVTVNSSGTVDNSVAGTYTITYSATDVAGNAAVTKTRTVIVYDPAAGFVSRFTSVTIPGNYTTPGTWDVSGGSGNSMILVGNFKWKLLYDFTSARSIEYKIVGNAAGAAQGWDSPYKWGEGGVFGAGNNATASVTRGRYAFELDEVLNSASLTRVGDLPPSALSYTPSSASGTVGTAITSLNPSVTGTVTSYSVNPDLPLGLTLSTSSGVISGTPSAASALDTYTVTATNGTGSTTATVTIEVAAAPVGSTFAGAYPRASMTDVAPNGLTYLANYAFGGNETTPATLPVQDTSDPTKLRLVVVFRTDDNSLTLGGQASTRLEAAWSSAGVTVVDGDSTGLSASMARKVISVDRGSDPKKFLRATVTK